MAATVLQFDSKQDVTPSNLTKETVCVTVSFGLLGNTRKVSNSAIQVDADKDLIRVNKTLLDSPELDAIKKSDGEMRRKLYDLCLPFDVGIYLLPVGLIADCVRKLREFKAIRAIQVERFISAYERLRDDARIRLRSLYNPKDYPSPDVIRKRFYCEWEFLSFGEAPPILAAISSDLMEEERGKQASKIQSASDNVVKMLYATFADVVEHLRERLTPGEDGKAKVLRDSAVSNVQDAIRKIRDFQAVSNDSDLSKLAADCESLLAGRNPDMLRASDNLRESVRVNLDSIKSQIDLAVSLKPSRKFRFDED